MDNYDKDWADETCEDCGYPQGDCHCERHAPDTNDANQFPAEGNDMY